jgi:hypothetical protein
MLNLNAHGFLALIIILCLVPNISAYGITSDVKNASDITLDEESEEIINETIAYFNVSEELKARESEETVVEEEEYKFLSFNSAVPSLEEDEQVLTISYSVNNSGVIGDSISVELWLIDDNEIEQARVVDGPFNINKDGVIERNVSMKLPLNLTGIFAVYLAPSYDLNYFARGSVILKEETPEVTGRVIFSNSRGKTIAYVIFLLVLFGFVIYRLRDLYKSRSERKFLSERE